jgi:hypothetical protein
MLTERGGATGATGRGASAPNAVSRRERGPGVLVIGSSSASRDVAGAALIQLMSTHAPTLALLLRGVG